MDKAKVIRVIRNGLAIFLVMLAMVWVRTYFSGRAQYLSGEKNFKAGNMKEAITNYETAIHMYTPLGGYVPASAERLWEIGRSFEQGGDYGWALIAFRSLRSSFYAVRSFYTPYPEWIARTEEEIDKVLAEQRRRQGVVKEAGPTPSGTSKNE